MTPAWERVARIVRESFQVVIEGDDWVGVVLEGAKVKVSAAQVLDRPYVAVVGDVCEADFVEPQIALALNHALQIGALENEHGRLSLRVMLPLAGLDEVDLRRVILHVCRQTAHMQRRRRSPATAVALCHYVD